MKTIKKVCANTKYFISIYNLSLFNIIYSVKKKMLYI